MVEGIRQIELGFWEALRGEEGDWREQEINWGCATKCGVAERENVVGRKEKYGDCVYECRGDVESMEWEWGQLPSLFLGRWEISKG